MGNSDLIPICRFPYWDVSESVLETKAVGDHGGFHLTSHAHDEDEDDELTGRVGRERFLRWKENGGLRPTPIKSPNQLESVQKPSEATNPELEVRQVDPITGENADYKVVINIDITVNVNSDYGDVSENTLDIDFISMTETLTALETDVVVPLVTDQAVVGDQREAVGFGVCEDLRWIVPEQDLPFGCN